MKLMATLYRALEKVLIIAESRDFRIPKIISILGRNQHGCEFVEFWGLPPLIPLLQYVNISCCYPYFWVK